MENVPDTDRQAKTFAMLAHLLALSQLVGVPFGHILGPLVIWLLKKEEFPFVNDQGKEALNFQISFTIYLLISIVLCFVLVGFLALAALGVVWVIFTIVAAVSASDGKAYRYPLTIRFIS